MGDEALGRLPYLITIAGIVCDAVGVEIARGAGLFRAGFDARSFCGGLHATTASSADSSPSRGIVVKLYLHI